MDGMRSVPVSAVGAVPLDLVLRVAAILADQRTLADVFQWGREQNPSRSVAAIITQDEYTHDVLMAFEGGHFLVFDAT
jgi:hypothetical protein